MKNFVVHLSELEGPLPHKIGHLKHVQELRFYRNLFNETIPSFSPFLCPEDKSNRTWKRAEQQKYVEAWPVLRQHVSKLKAVYFGKVSPFHLLPLNPI